jgi:hypothetical protein
MLSIAASAVGAKPPRFGVPLALMYAFGATMGMASRLLRRDLPMNVRGVRLMHIMSPADHSKAERELGWSPRPTAESLAQAAQFYVDREKAGQGLKSRLMG